MGQYGMSEGEPALREALALKLGRWAYLARRVRCWSSAAPSKPSIWLPSCTSTTGTEILLEAPTYLAALQIFQLFGADCITVPLEADGPDLAQLRSRLEQHRPAFIYLIPTFQNPSAVRYSEAKRDAVAALLDEFGVTLIEDEPYRELTFDGGSAHQ